MSSFGGLSIAVSGLFAQQRSLDVTGHNISNVNTIGYSRQSVIHASSSPQQIGWTRAGVKMGKGTGVDAVLIMQYRDEFLDNKIRKIIENAFHILYAALLGCPITQLLIDPSYFII